MRDITALAFSEDGETLRCTTSSGDFVGVDLRTKQVSRQLAQRLFMETLVRSVMYV